MVASDETAVRKLSPVKICKHCHYLEIPGMCKVCCDSLSDDIRQMFLHTTIKYPFLYQIISKDSNVC